MYHDDDDDDEKKKNLIARCLSIVLDVVFLCV